MREGRRGRGLAVQAGLRVHQTMIRVGEYNPAKVGSRAGLQVLERGYIETGRLILV
jgi:hypothetical protein